ncbi:hypothetical protein [Paenibacillus apiarius]|uniref:Uncharacterized protein n=1 Tax=Paenibacillus apiarius TaxID=46240 RepID=A0ABT4E555_9BACL|nr:hypothetical protein [Paenibacillus apiarius]MCY9517914.1 hypothetical protein [Paenibacillus apiarius]MCY9523381.1 hypothetical protein [Paenibacillus apiarius]MCY9555560.1 hypothetical protein [Paenibacillus apiarius]MCY9561567.1 hypothetical protein [Paenibacillus apiarius]MCY9687160.1 hypothetical protein [Paenibacillus apiarius]
MSIFNDPPQLQPLRIPSTWLVTYNGFLEIDPKEVSPEDDTWLSFTQDLLQLQHNRYDIIVDLGWYPEAEPEGEYGLKLIKEKDWERPIGSLNTKNKDEVVHTIEMWLWRVGGGDF